jgi:hypothetical protein
MVVREQILVTLTVEQIRRKLPFSMLGLDVDNDSALINESVLLTAPSLVLKLRNRRSTIKLLKCTGCFLRVGSAAYWKR